VLALASGGSAHATAFVNSDVEAGRFSSWTLGADYEPSGHTSYFDPDGFGTANPVNRVNPVTTVSEPATFAILGMGLFSLVAAWQRGRA
jgi:hypothetical protein